MNSSIIVELAPALSDAEAEQIVRSLVSHNDAQAAPQRQQTLNVVARQGEQLVGGLLGFTNWGWLSVHILWVAQELRGRGVGRQLLLAAEAEARARGCCHAHLNTFSFQALGFYERLGYRVFGQLEDYPAGHTKYYLQKRDLSAPDSAPPATR